MKGRTLTRSKLGFSARGYAFVLPAFVLIGFIFINPIIRMFLFSLEGWSYLKPQGFNDFRNYLELLSDPHFYSTMLNNVIIILGVVPVTAVIALAFGQAIFSRIPGYRLYTFLFFIPVVLPDVVIARVLTEVLNKVGPLNAFFSADRARFPGAGLARGARTLPVLHHRVPGLEEHRLRPDPVPGAPDHHRHRHLRSGGDRRGEPVAEILLHHPSPPLLDDQDLHRAAGDRAHGVPVQLHPRDDRRRARVLLHGARVLHLPEHLPAPGDREGQRGGGDPHRADHRLHLLLRLPRVARRAEGGRARQWRR